MYLSNEQNAVVMHGTRPANRSYEWVDVPAGPQPLPDWVCGLHISWMEGYSNPPHYMLKVRGEPWKWEHVYAKDGDRYMSVAPDGHRAHILYHGGELVSTELTRRIRSLVPLPAPIPAEARRGCDYRSWQFKLGSGPWYYWDVPYTKLATYKDRGFGGEAYHIKLDDGREVVLRGPWHGATPPGWVDVGGRGTGRGGSSGMTITEDLLVLLIARYHAECRVARVTQYGHTEIQAVRGDWDEPKAWMEEKRRAASQI